MPETRSDSVRFGRFEVFGRLGFGGMGEVFRAVDTDGTQIALKLLRPEYAGQRHFRDMFNGEAQVGALLHHPNVVRLIDAGEIDGMLYLATELIEGASLDKILESGPLPVGVAVYLLEQLLGALHYAHELSSAEGAPLNIVHRDVSASNAMVSSDGDVKLTDFGLAKIEGLALTLTNEVKGKRAYMAPEQHDGGAMDRRVDVFAIGVLVHELVVGKRPFPDVLEWMRGTRVVCGTPFDEIITKAIEIDPKRRYASAAELAAALRAAHPPGIDAALHLQDRVRQARDAVRPLNQFDRLLMHDLASVSPPRPAPEKASGELEATRRGIVRRGFSDAVTIERDGVANIAVAETVPLDVSIPTQPDLPPMPAEPSPALAVSAVTIERELPRAMVGERPPARRALVIGTVVAALVGTFTVAWFYGSNEARGPTLTAVPPTTEVKAPPKTEPVPARPSPVEPAPIQPVIVDPAKLEPPAPAQHVRPVAHAASARDASAPGFLVLDTTPWSAVYLGGKRLGTTPLRVPLPPGKHQLVLQAKETGERRPLRVVITSGREQRVSLQLQ